MEFVQDIYEGRMLRDENNAKVLTFTDCCERLYLTVLILEVLRQYPKYEIMAKAYASDVIKHHPNYKIFRGHAPDLYNLIYFVIGDTDAINKLKDPKAAQSLRDKTSLPLMTLNGYLSQIATSKEPAGYSGLFMRLETALRITNGTYKEIRRSISNLRKLTSKDRREVVTKLVLATRAKLRNSDIIRNLEELVSDKDLETLSVQDNEPKISIPDVVLTGSDLALYKYLVGTENVVLAKRFVDLARNNQSIPSSVVKGYVPIIKLIDDIIKGGPSYLNQLRALHQRAKNDSK